MNRVSRRAAWLLSNLLLVMLMLSAPTAARAAERFQMAAALAGHIQRVDCRIIGGRIDVTSQQRGGQVSTAIRRGDGEVQESLSIDFNSGWPQIDYQAANARQQIHITVSLGQQISILLNPAAGEAGPQITFKQQPEGLLEFSYRDANAATHLSGPTFWHLWLTAPETCQDELLPLLQLLRADWDLDNQGDAVERALVVAAQANWTAEWPRWRAFVAQLADDQFSTRRQADKELRKAGLPTVPFLRSLDLTRLEPEQRSRIRSIVAHLSRFDSEDSPDRAAIWLVADPRVWLALLAREDESLRRTAAGELAEILGTPIEFESAADAATRAGQIARLAIEINRRFPMPPAK